MGLDLSASFSDPISLGSGSVLGARLSAGMSLCLGVEAVQGCVLASGGVLSLSGRGYVNASDALVASGALGAAVEAFWPMSPKLGLAFQAGLEFPLNRVSLLVGEATLWRSERVSISGTMGCYWRL